MKNMEKFLGTQKWLVCVVVLALLCAGTAFAQARPAAAASAAKPNAVALDLMPLFKGLLASDAENDVIIIPIALSYERRIAAHMSIGGNVDMYFGKVGEYNNDDIPYFYFGLTGVFRYYPMSDSIDKFFVGAMVGFNILAIDGKTESNGGFAGPLIGVNFGYKITLGPSFFIEPAMSFVYAKSDGISPLGWQGGLRMGVLF